MVGILKEAAGKFEISPLLFNLKKSTTSTHWLLIPGLIIKATAKAVTSLGANAFTGCSLWAGDWCGHFSFCACYSMKRNQTS